MLGAQTGKLGQLVNVANQWRDTTASQGVTLTQVNVVMPDGRALALIWSEGDTDWLVQVAT